MSLGERPLSLGYLVNSSLSVLSPSLEDVNLMKNTTQLEAHFVRTKEDYLVPGT